MPGRRRRSTGGGTRRSSSSRGRSKGGPRGRRRGADRHPRGAGRRGEGRERDAPERQGAQRGKAGRPRKAPPERDVWIGILGRRGRQAHVTPYRDDFDWSIPIGKRELGDARDGDVVVVAPVVSRKRRARRGLPSRGRIVEVLGRPGDAEADFRAVVWRRELPVEFPESALAAAEALSEGLPPEEIARRVDLRDRPFVTIDPATARDHDDAVCVELAAGGASRLWVAIADVSHYVDEGSALDAEALRRGNSVYFPDRAIPMLPERLSSELCSLRPDVDRPAFAVELEVDRAGRVQRSSFYPAVIRSRARLVYEDAARAMEGDASGFSEEIATQLRRLRRLTRSLQERRFAEGSIDFDLPTAEIVLGDDLRPVDLVEAPRTVAHRAVEEAMLVANRAVAEALEASDGPAIFRNHEAPLPEDLEDLLELFEAFGLGGGDPREALEPRGISRALAQVAGRPEERLVNQVVLRSMRQARYEPRCRGHFALAFDHYLHFTSPIRRYADLVVHRALRALLDEREAPAARPGRLERVAERLSTRERLAMDAEREVVDLKKCAFMAAHVGFEYEGTVTGVAPHGLYVTLDDFFVDGLVHVSRLPGYLSYDERSHALVAGRGGPRFRLGDRMRVRVAAADPVRARIDFSPVEPGPRRRR